MQIYRQRRNKNFNKTYTVTELTEIKSNVELGQNVDAGTNINKILS